MRVFLFSILHTHIDYLAQDCCFLSAFTMELIPFYTHINGLAQDCGYSSALALALPQSCAQPLTWSDYVERDTFLDTAIRRRIFQAWVIIIKINWNCVNDHVTVEICQSRPGLDLFCILPLQKTETKQKSQNSYAWCYI